MPKNEVFIQDLVSATEYGMKYLNILNIELQPNLAKEFHYLKLTKTNSKKKRNTDTNCTWKKKR